MGRKCGVDTRTARTDTDCSYVREETKMLIRLLVVVLTVVGPMPFRVCTCAASLPPRMCADAPAPVPAKAMTKKSCGCESGPIHSAPARHVAPPHANTDCSSPSTGDAPHQDRHDRDCPATNPAPVVRDAVTPPAVDSPTDCSGPVLAVLVQPSQLLITSVARRPAPPRASKLPLYITLLSIRN